MFPVCTSVVFARAKFLESRVLRGVPYEREVVLTSVGRTVAEKIKAIEEIIEWMGKNGIT